jgi:hypothetical protein
MEDYITKNPVVSLDPDCSRPGDPVKMPPRLTGRAMILI